MRMLAQMPPGPAPMITTRLRSFISPTVLPPGVSGSPRGLPSCRRLHCQERALGVGTSQVLPDRPVTANDPMTWDDDRQWVGRAGGPDGAHCRGAAGRGSDRG